MASEIEKLILSESKQVDETGPVSLEQLLANSRPKQVVPEQPKEYFTEDFYERVSGVPIPIGKVSTRTTFGDVVPTPEDERSKLSAGSNKTSFVQDAVDSLGKMLGFDTNILSEQAKADATVQVMAKRAGVPLHEYRRSPELVEQAAASFVSGFTFGTASAIQEAITGEVPFPVTSTEGHVGHALGSLGGFLAGPVQAVSKIPMVAKFLKATKATQEMSTITRIIKDGLHQSVLLGLASGVGSIGEASKETTFGEAAYKIYEGTKSGAITGAIFGYVKGAFPKEGWDVAKRLITGLVGLNAQRAIELEGNHFTNRPIGDVLFDIGLDAVFLFGALPSADVKQLGDQVQRAADAKAEVKAKEAVVEGIPDQEIRIAQQKILESQKQQADKLAQDAAKEAKDKLDEVATAAETAEKLTNAKKKAGKKKETPEQTAERMARVRAARKVDTSARPNISNFGTSDTIEKKISRYERSLEQVRNDMASAEEGGFRHRHLQNEASIIEGEISKLRKSLEVKQARFSSRPQTGVSEFPVRQVEQSVEPEKPGTLAQPTPERPLPGIKPKSGIAPIPVEKPKLDSKIEQSPIVTEQPKPKVDFFGEDKPPSDPEITGAQIDALEKHYGKDIEDLTDAEVNAFLNNTKVTPEQRLAEEAQVTRGSDRRTVDERYADVERRRGERRGVARELAEQAVEIADKTEEQKISDHYKKPFEQVSEKEIDAYYDLDPGEVVPESLKAKEVEPVTDTDLKTGSPEISEITGEDSIFLQDLETTKGMAEQLASNKAVAGNIKELFEQDPTQPRKRPDTTTWKLVNDVNRWLHGEDIPIESTREFLSELAARADEFKYNFVGGGYPESFFAWKEGISDAADWARKTERSKNERSGTSLYSGLDPFEAYKQVKKLAADILRKDSKDRESLGIKLYSGLDPEEAARQVIKLGREFSDYVKEARKAKEFKPKEVLKTIREEWTRSVIDRSGNARRELLDLGDKGYEALQGMVLQKGAHPKAARMFSQMEKEVYGGRSKNEQDVIDELILARRIIAITDYKVEGKQFVPPAKATRDRSVSYNELYMYKSMNGLEDLSPESAAKVNRAVEAYGEWHRKVVKEAFEEGLITEKAYNELITHNYRRIRPVDEIFDHKHEVTLGGKKISVYDSGIERLQKGKSTDLYEPSGKILALETFNRLYGRIFNNRANAELFDIAENDPQNPIVRMENKKYKIPEEFRANKVFVYKNGERKTLFLNPDFAKEWLTSDLQITSKLANVIKWVGGAPILKTFATGINWAFAIRNLPKDITGAWFSARTFKDGKWSSVYNPTAPIGAAQFAKDIAAIGEDVVFRKGRFEDYIDEGGGMELLTSQGRLFQKGKFIGGPLDKTMEFLGYPGTTSELTTRLAIRHRVIQNRANARGISYEEAYKDKKLRREATFTARDWLDFSQGGDIAKAADHFAPYLNARIQGMRGFFRTLKPGSGTEYSAMYKLAQFAGLVTAMYIGNDKLNPETMKALRNDLRAVGNLIIPLGDPFAFEDENGEKRYPFIKIPIDSTLQFFKSVFEAGTDHWLGRPVDVDKIKAAGTGLSPADVSSLPPTLSAAIGYTWNIDLWKGQDIFKGNQGKTFSYPNSAQEFSNRTPQAMVDVGAATGLSPDRLKFVLEELVTSDSMYAQMLGAGYNKMFGNLSQDQREILLAEWLSEFPGSKTIIGVTNPSTRFSQLIDEKSEDHAIKVLKENRGLDKVADNYLHHKNGKLDDVDKYIYGFKDKDVRDRLKDRFKFKENTKDLQNRSFWLRLKGLPTEVRAAVYVDRYEESTEKERQQLFEEEVTVKRLGGVITPEFRKEVLKLQMR